MAREACDLPEEEVAESLGRGRDLNVPAVLRSEVPDVDRGWLHPEHGERVSRRV